jgi:hypothetical protein
MREPRPRSRAIFLIRSEGEWETLHGVVAEGGLTEEKMGSEWRNFRRERKWNLMHEIENTNIQAFFRVQCAVRDASGRGCGGR